MKKGEAGRPSPPSRVSDLCPSLRTHISLTPSIYLIRVATGTMIGVAMVAIGVTYNLEVYLIKGFNVGRIDATQMYGVANGCISLAPVLGGVIADSFLGCSTVLVGGAASCFLGMLLFTLTAIWPSLRPPPCHGGAVCQPPTTAQLSVLFSAVGLLAAGVGGTRYNGMTLGANQLFTDADRAAFFNWAFIALYLSSIAGATVLVYVQDSAGWHWGFALCAAIAAISFLLYFRGKPYFTPSKHNHSNDPFSSFRRNGNALIRLLPIISAGILLSAAISLQTSLTVLQAMVMDRRVGGLLIPAGSINVFVLATAAASITAVDRAGRSIAPLRRIAIGHVINILAMAAMAATESRRLAAARPLSVLWLVPPLMLIGFGEAFHFPGSVAFYYQDFPASLRSTATGTFAIVSGLGFYVSSAIISVIRRVTSWLQDDVNESRLDCVYGALALVCLLNFGYFMLCSWFYRRRRAEAELSY
ncbi:Nitrate excretion transporter 1 [Apostasia shenzhenica]|uniref:Nitrate excretion transporter 1 n=1 Tax=Apostasia shenzhenica TaxID=1088818 RepID=A0A2I0BAN2_9ASPA|nr:Nitrate excretion transporter 1 [Apostasia shenzhenica]